MAYENLADASLCGECGIYRIVGPKGWAYVGQSAKIKYRIRQHRIELRKNKHHASKLQNAWNKYGEDAFSFEVIETFPRDPVMLVEREQFHMDAHANLYNTALAAGSTLGVKQSAETRAKWLAKNKGKVRSAESRARYAAAQRGKIVPEWVGEKISQALRGKKRSPETLERIREAAAKRVVSEETRAKMRASHARRAPPSAETIEKVRQSHIGKKRSAEACANMSAAHRNSSYRPSLETRRKMSEARRLAWTPERTRKMEEGRKRKREAFAVNQQKLF